MRATPTGGGHNGVFPAPQAGPGAPGIALRGKGGEPEINSREMTKARVPSQQRPSQCWSQAHHDHDPLADSPQRWGAHPGRGC